VFCVTALGAVIIFTALADLCIQDYSVWLMQSLQQLLSVL
jgi:hypothetical protein